MSLPYMSNKSMMRSTVRTQHGGLNHNLNAQDGEIFWTKNMSAKEFPLLCPRDRRGLVRTLASPKGIGVQDDPFWVASGKFFYNGEEKGPVDAATEKQFAVIGNKVIIFPDKKFYDINVDKMGDMGDKFGSMELEQKFSNLAFKNGEISDVPAEANTLYKSGAEWEFSEGDAVTISGCTIHPENNKTAIVREVDGDYLRFSEGTFKLDSTLVYTVPTGGLTQGTYHFEEGQFTLDGSQTSARAMFQNGSLNGTIKAANTIYKQGAAWQFHAGEIVTISGCTTHPGNNKTAIIREVDGDYLRFDENTFTLDNGLRYNATNGLPNEIYNYDDWQFHLFHGMLKPAYPSSAIWFKNGTLNGVSTPANTVYCPGASFDHFFQVGDEIKFTISGNTAVHTENSVTAILREVDGDNLRFDANTFTLDIVGGVPTDYEEYGRVLIDKGPQIVPPGSIIEYHVGAQGESNYLTVIRPNGEREVITGTDMSQFGVQVPDDITFTSGLVEYTEPGSITVTCVAPPIAEGATLTWNGSNLDVDDNGNTYQIPVTAGDAGVYLIFADIPTDYTESAEISIKRSVPDLDYICVNENRLWGCKGDTIYASALGDPFNFNVFDGLSTDSWQSDTTDAGDFTGCVSYQGYPIFFKEDSIFKVQGDGATNFAWTRTSRFGVKAGSHKSLAVAGETLFYLSRVGICAYQGGMPTVVSDPLGANVKWQSAVAGSDGLRYYVDLYDGTAHNLYVFDTRYRVWHREDETAALGFAFWGGGLHMLGTNGKLWRMDGSSGTRESSLAWEVIFADSVNFYETSESGSERKKGPLRMLIRATLAWGASVTVKISYDDGDDMTVGTLAGGGKKQTYVLPMILRRCDHYRLCLEGNGEAVIYSISMERYNGSEFQGTGTVN